jgi:hypothetical protein
MRLCAFASVVTISCALSANAQSLDQQERCAQQARRAFQELNTENRTEGQRFRMTVMSADYQSHYNTRLGKCLMLVETTYMSGSEFTTTAQLMDAKERRLYATYGWRSKEGKRYWEVPPTTCELTPSLREKKLCSSREEFDAFAANYMEE